MTKRFFKLAALCSAVVVFLASTVYAQDKCCGKTCAKAPEKAKYVFFFIGDGMGFSHIALTEAYKAQKKGIIGSEPLFFTQLPVLGMATTYSASNIITCSSAAATALSSGIKTNNNTVGVYPDSIPVRQMTYDLKEQGYSIGIMTSVTIDHATPAGFYAHCVDRDGYYDIAMQLPESGFDFFGGGGFQGARSKKIENAHKNIYDKCAGYGYTIAYGLDDYKAKKGADKLILFQNRDKKVDEILPFVIGRKEDDLKLKEVLESAIDFLYKPEGKGFFIMCEGGKIDWSAHDNDMPGTIMETLDMDEAIKVAYSFYEQHPDETLIVITADHETGGLTLGRTKGYTFDLTGVDAAKADVDNGKYTVEEYFKQEHLDSLSVAAKIGWTTSSHTGGAVPVFAVGAGSRMFAGRIDNTDIPKNILKAMGVTPKYTAYYYKRLEIFKREAPVGKNDIVFLGNSLTEGGKWDTYFPRTNAALAKKGGAIRNRGIVGDTFGGIDNRLEEIIKGQPAKLFLLTGVNDVSHNLTADQVAEGIIALVRKIKEQSPKTKIYLQSLLPINESFGRYRLLTGKTSMIPEINAMLQRYAKEEKVTFVNLYPLFLAQGEEVLNPALTSDGLHLNGEGYKIWADAIGKYVK